MSKLYRLMALAQVLTQTLMAGFVIAAQTMPPSQGSVTRRKLPPGARGFERYAAREASEKLYIGVCGRGSGGHPAYVVIFCRGYAQYEEGKYQGAAESFKQATVGKSDWAQAHYSLGVTYEALGQYREAIEAYKQAINLKPEFPQSLYNYYNLANAYAAAGQYQEAVEAYKQVSRLAPDLSPFPLHYNMGLAYAASHREKEAVEAFKEAAKILAKYSDDSDLKQRLAPAYYNLGLAYAGLGQLDEAIGAFKEAVRLKPSYAEAQYNLGLAYYLTDNQAAFREQQTVLKTLKPELAKELEQLSSAK